MFIRIAVPVTLYANIEVKSVNLPDTPLHLIGDNDAADALIDEINARIAEFLGQEEGLSVTASPEYPAISHVRVFPEDEKLPSGEWVEVDRQDEIKREIGPLYRTCAPVRI